MQSNHSCGMQDFFMKTFHYDTTANCTVNTAFYSKQDAKVRWWVGSSHLIVTSKNFILVLFILHYYHTTNICGLC